MMVLLADRVGADVLFDDVGASFDPDAVRAAHRDRIATLEDLARSTDPDAAHVDDDTVAQARAPERFAADQTSAAIDAIEAAHARTR